MAKLDVVHGWNQVRDYLPADFSALADEHAQVETKFGNSKIRDAETLLRFILLHVGANLGLRQTVALMAEAGLPSLSPMRLHKKMCRAAPYLQALVSRLVNWSDSTAPERWGGYVFTAVDATVVCGPGAVGTDARIHTKLRLADVCMTGVQVTDEHIGESFCRFDWQPGELAVGDRAYWTGPGISHVLRAGADVLVRWRLKSLPLLAKNGDIVDVLAKLRRLKHGAVLDEDLAARCDGGPIDGRLIAMRLPDDAAERARQRVRKEKGASASAESLEAAGFVVLFTTALRDRLSAERCLEGYRVRWQIELQFKRWKSLCGFDMLPNQRDDTILAWLYAKVLLGALLDRMASIPTEISPPASSNVATDGMRSLEADQHPVPPRHRRAAATRAA